MYNRVINYLKQHEILYKYQFGFRENHSTNVALSILIDKISETLKDKNMFVGVFLDIQKAFDTVNHKILLDKLYKYGIRGNAYKWFESYLTNRKQFVLYNNVKSSLLDVECGVPQGSIRGSILFLVYINDIAHVSSVLLPIIFC